MIHIFGYSFPDDEDLFENFYDEDGELFLIQKKFSSYMKQQSWRMYKHN
jgi:hypothetical protein